MESLNFTSAESTGYAGSEDASSVQDYNNSFADIVWSALSTTTIFLIIIFIVTCIRVLLVGTLFIVIFLIIIIYVRSLVFMTSH